MPVRYHLLGIMVIIVVLSGIVVQALSFNIVISEKVDPGTVEEIYDSTPYVKILLSILSLINSNNLDEAKRVLYELYDIPVPEKLSYMNNRTLSLLNKTIYLLEELENDKHLANDIISRHECVNASDLVKVIRNHIISLFALKNELIDSGLLYNYVKELVTYINDTGMRFNLYRRSNSEIRSLVSFIERKRDEAAQLISSLQNCNSTSRVFIDIFPEKHMVLGGSYLDVVGRIHFRNNTSIPYANISIGFSLPGFYWHENVVADDKGFFSSIIPIPPSQSLQELYLNVRGGQALVRARLSAYTSIFLNDRKVMAYNETVIVVKYLKPAITLLCPTNLYQGNVLNISSKNNIESPLNASLYIDGKILYNITLVPGSQNIIIGSNVSLGLHTLTLIVKPYREYLSAYYSCTFAVVKRIPSLKISLNDVVVYPSQTINIYAIITNPVKGLENKILISVVVDGRRVYETNGTMLNTSLNPPLTYLIQYHSVDIIISGGGFNYTRYHYNVLVINPFGVIASLSLILIGFSINIKYDVLALPRIILRIGRTIRRRRIERKVVVEKHTGGKIVTIRRWVKYTFSKIAIIYWRTVRMLSRYIGVQSPSETLREYLHRAKSVLSKTKYQLFEKITLITEKDLYSKEKATDKEVMEVERLLRRLQSEE